MLKPHAEMGSRDGMQDICLSQFLCIETHRLRNARKAVLRSPIRYRLPSSPPDAAGVERVRNPSSR